MVIQWPVPAPPPDVPPDWRRSGETPEWLGLRARTTPDAIAVIAGERTWTFTELDRDACRTARQLATLGVTSGSRAALLLRNGAPLAILAHALGKLGAVMVPMNTRLAAPELTRQLEDIRARILICDRSLEPLAGAAAEALPDLARCTVGGATEAAGGCDLLPGVAEARAPLRDRFPLSDVQGIMYTSATSGRPKGVQLSYGNHWWSAIGSAANLGHERRDRWLACLPLYHVGGLAILWRGVIYGIPVVVHEAFDPERVGGEIDRGGVTLLSLVPTMLQRLLDARGPRRFPPALRCILLGGGPAPPSLLEACVSLRAPVAPTYGLTETASQVATLPPEEAARRPGSVGRALCSAELRIERDGMEAPAGEVGEILVRGPTVMLGYVDRPERPGQSFPQGWLRTGDLGYLDAEGYLYVVDRRDDLIVSGGENVYPAEVETVLRQHPAVEDAGVVGLPDPVWGQMVAAAVTAQPGARPNEEELRTFCAGRIAGYKIPRRIWFVEALPRSTAGKLLRRTVRAWAAEALDRDRK